VRTGVLGEVHGAMGHTLLRKCYNCVAAALRCCEGDR
jgi:hypothetical protein